MEGNMFKWYQRNKEVFWVSVIAGIAVIVFMKLIYLIFNFLPPLEEIAKSASVNWFFVATNFLIFILLTAALACILYRKNFTSFLKQKLKEIFELFLEEDRQYKIFPIDKRYNCFSMYRAYDDSITFFNDFVCYNQGEIAQIYYEAGELHKPIKEEVKKDQPDPDKIQKLCDEINSKLYERLDGIFEANNEFILKHFNGRSDDTPRWCIKGIDPETKLIMDLYRFDCEYSSLPVEPSDNTGFDEVIKNGYRYLNNSIPKAVIDEKYYNPRIEGTEVRRKNNYGDNLNNHEEWLKCWIHNEKKDGTKEGPSPKSAYRSTLIIPITLLRNDKLTKDFRKHFDIPKKNDTEEYSRAIMGMLCFDHIDTNFFVDDIDTPAGYVIADIFSLYLLASAMYTDYSKSYQKAKKMINSANQAN